MTKTQQQAEQARDRMFRRFIQKEPDLIDSDRCVYFAHGLKFTIGADGCRVYDTHSSYSEKRRGLTFSIGKDQSQVIDQHKAFAEIRNPMLVKYIARYV